MAAADGKLFPGAAQAFRLRRDVGGLDEVATSKYIVYGSTSLPAELAGTEHLNYYERRHWVETRLHWTSSPGGSPGLLRDVASPKVTYRTLRNSAGAVQGKGDSRRLQRRD